MRLSAILYMSRRMKSSSFENAKKNNIEISMNQSRKYFSKGVPVHQSHHDAIKSHYMDVPSPLATK